MNVFGPASFEYYERVNKQRTFTEYGIETNELDECREFSEYYELYKEYIDKYANVFQLLESHRAFMANEKRNAKYFYPLLKQMLKKVFDVDEQRHIEFRLHIGKATDIVESWPEWKQNILRKEHNDED